ncbi:Uncharacterised protein [Shigella sonnei]|nr:Uncharacterised protein [Shigella sonnei]
MFGNCFTFRLPVTGIFQPVRNLVIHQLRFGFDGGGKEFDIIFNGAISGERHAACQYRADFIGAQ